MEARFLECPKVRLDRGSSMSRTVEESQLDVLVEAYLGIAPGDRAAADALLCGWPVARFLCDVARATRSIYRVSAPRVGLRRPSY